LEFLGDAVLELIISEYLYNNFPERPEGELTSFRSAIVRSNSLAKCARKLGYGEVLDMSRGEEATGGREKDYLLANTFEAVLGAIFLDQGIDVARDFVLRVLIPNLQEIVDKRLDIDSKSKFQEIIQKIDKITPVYKVEREEGPDHAKTFTVTVFVGNEVFGTGSGASKQQAEEAAAEAGLKKVHTDKRYITA
jgi:ribonuclease-3